MTYEEKKEWLRRYRKAAKLEKIKLEEVERYRTDAEHITQVLSPVPGGAGDGQALPRSVERITDAMQAANAQVMECQRTCKEILSVMNQTVDIQDYEILYLRYIGGKKWEQIAIKMGMEQTIGSPSILTMRNGDKDLDGLIASIDKGILVSGFNGGNCNSTTGDFSYGVEGFLIERGKLSQPISEMNATGNMLSLWSNLAEVGNDPRLSSSWRIPSLLFNGVDFSGL